MTGSHHASSSRIPAGTSEVYGVEMRRRQAAIDTIRGTYEAFGFDPLHTPILEHAEVFDGHHGEGEKLLFKLTDSGGIKLVNRYDLTVPLARFAGAHPEIPRPLKRYQIATVFRDDRPDLGHFREFTQCDGDVVGNPSLSADAEVINVACAGLTRLGFSAFRIRVSHRGIIKAIAEKAGVADASGTLIVQRALDFSDKVAKSGISGVRDDLANYGIPSNVIDVIVEMIMLDGDGPLDKLAKIQRALSFSEVGQMATEELGVILGMLPPNILEKVSVDLTLARGADCYTGFILEGVIDSVPVGAVLGGGRYDDLIGKFGNRPEPAVGMAFGLERIITAMRLLGMFDDAKLQQRILVVANQEIDERRAISIVNRLRFAGIPVDYLPHGINEDVANYARHRGFCAIIEFVDDCNYVASAIIDAGKELITRALPHIS